MRTADLETLIYTFLTDDEPLISKLYDGEDSIYHLQAPAGDFDRYPILVYSPISDVPSMFADDEEFFHRVTIRFHIVTADGEYTEIYADIQRIMKEIGGTRIQTMPFIAEDGLKMLITDYKLRVDDNMTCLLAKMKLIKTEDFKPQLESTISTETLKIDVSTIAITDEEIEELFTEAEKEG